MMNLAWIWRIEVTAHLVTRTEDDKSSHMHAKTSSEVYEVGPREMSRKALPISCRTPTTTVTNAANIIVKL